MENSRTIPIVVGVTGHRVIREQDRAAVYDSVKTELRKLMSLCPNSPVVMLNSLAEGGDQLCADAAEELDIPLIAVLPTERETFEKDFCPEAAARFARHCARAERVFVSPYTEAAPEVAPGRDYLFRQAGIFVASHSHVMLALWDGGPGTAAACGTADAVDFALNGLYAPAAGAAVRSGSNEAVIHIFVPRGDQTGEPAGTVHILGNREAALAVLRETDEFNRQAGRTETGEGFRLPTDADEYPILRRMERISLAAGKLSARYACRYRLVLALLAVASALLTFSFLLYDEAHAVWMILICGLMLLGAWSCRRFAARSDCHRRYLEYRALAECLRVQTYLGYAGSGIEASGLLSWTQQEETAWVLDALCALTAFGLPGNAHDIRDCWVEEQRRYHQRAERRSRRDLRTSERIVHFALALSIGLYLAAVLFELFSGGEIVRPVVSVREPELWRTVLKILLGTISAVTLFTANYYGRLSLSRRRSDHEKMGRFYEKMTGMLEHWGQTEELLSVLAREELTENGSWLAYQRDNRPDISL